jgi:hypothetical protein
MAWTSVENVFVNGTIFSRNATQFDVLAGSPLVAEAVGSAIGSADGSTVRSVGAAGDPLTAVPADVDAPEQATTSMPTVMITSR